MLVYLGVCAVLAFLAALATLVIAVLPGLTFGIAAGSDAALVLAISPAAAFHLAFASGAMPLIFGAIIHFVPVLTRGTMPARPVRSLPLLVQLAGIATPLGLAGWLPAWSLHAAAATVSGVAGVLLLWVTRRLRTAFGPPHPGARWYGAALLCLFLAVSLVPVWLVLPELRPALRLFHLHLNTLGFIGLAALGTLPVLLPTLLGQPERHARERLQRTLPLAAAGAVLIAAGAATTFWIALVGALLLGWVAIGNLWAWQRAFGMPAIVRAGGTASLAAATAGFLLLLLAGIGHAAGAWSARPALAAFVALFLLPLVTGALSQLLPVWRFPGADTPQRRAMARQLARGGQWRACLFIAGGLLLAFDFFVGILPALLGLLMFAAVLLMAFRLDRSGGSDDNSRPVRPPPYPPKP